MILTERYRPKNPHSRFLLSKKLVLTETEQPKSNAGTVPCSQLFRSAEASGDELMLLACYRTLGTKLATYLAETWSGFPAEPGQPPDLHPRGTELY